MDRKLFQTRIVTWLYTGIMLTALLPVCMKNGKIDYFLLWVILGIPYGMGKLILILFPRNYGIGESIGILVFGCLLSGLIGGVILVYKLISAIFILVIYISSIIIKICRIGLCWR